MPGIRVLVRLQDAATATHYRYAVVRGPPQIHRAFVLCRLVQMLTFTDGDTAGAAIIEPRS